MRDFVKICLTKDPKQRPSVDDLMRHSFITKMDYTKAKSDFKEVIIKYQDSTNNVESIFSVS